MQKVKRSVVSGAGMGSNERVEHRGFFFSGSETTLYTIITDLSSYTFVQTLRMHNEE